MLKRFDGLPVLLLHRFFLRLELLVVTHEELDLPAHLPRDGVGHELALGSHAELLEVHGLLLVEAVEFEEAVVNHLLRQLLVLALVEEDLHEQLVGLLA